jgi:hypothetical protein
MTTADFNISSVHSAANTATNATTAPMASTAPDNSDLPLTGTSSARERLNRLPPLAYGGLTLGSRYLLSPLAGFTNLPFRRIVRESGGVGLGTTDLVNARGREDLASD